MRGSSGRSEPRAFRPEPGSTGERRAALARQAGRWRGHGPHGVCPARDRRGGADRARTGQSRADPRLPAHGELLRGGCGGTGRNHISGTEYAGAPYPLIGVNTYLPAGVKLHPQGFPTCPPQTVLVKKEPSRCPKGSAAGPVGRVEGEVSFGGTRVKETSEVFSFFAPGGGFRSSRSGIRRSRSKSRRRGPSRTLTVAEDSGRSCRNDSARGNGPGRAGRFCGIDQDHPRGRLPQPRQARLLRHGAKDLPEGRVPRQGQVRFEAGTGTPVNVTVPFRAPCPTH